MKVQKKGEPAIINWWMGLSSSAYRCAG